MRIINIPHFYQLQFIDYSSRFTASTRKIVLKMSQPSPETSKSEIHAEPSTPTKRRDFSVGEKVELLIKYDALPKMSQAKAARELGISKQLMCRILQHRADIMQSYLHNRDTNRKRKRCGKDGEVETALKEWFDHVCAEGATVTGPIMRKKAEELAKELGKDDFVATDGWFSRWRKRENIVLLGRPRCESNLEAQPGQWSEMLAAYSAECVYGTENTSQKEQESDASCIRTDDSPDTSTPQKCKENVNSTPDTSVRGIVPHCSTKRRDLSVSEKLEILTKYDVLPPMSQSLAASQLGISQPLLCKILKTRHDIEQESLQHSSRKRKRCGKDGEVETALKEWFEHAQKVGATLTGPIMRKKAEELARELGKEDFIATDGWFSRWRKRENITTPGKSRAPCEPTLQGSNCVQPADFCDESTVDDRLIGMADTNTPFDEVASTKPGVFPVQCVYGEGTTELDVKPVITSTTSDERVLPMYPTPRNGITALPDDFPPDNVYSVEMSEIDYLSKPWCFSDENEHEFPLERLGILCCVSIGGQKQKLLVVGQRDNRCFKNIRQLPVDYYYNDEARITPHIIFDWLMKWDRDLDHEIILMVDDYHNLRTITSFKNLIFQPVDERLRSGGSSISAYLKSRFTELKKHHLKWMLTASGDTPGQSTDPQKTDFISLLHIIAKSWENVSQSWLLDRFLNCGFLTPERVSRFEDTGASQLKIEEFDDGASSSYLIIDQNDCVPPSNQDVREALAVLTRAVYHRADEFNLHYQYEMFIKSLQ